jgi:RNA polymerase sigma-70 factor (ECF subfamily)
MMPCQRGSLYMNRASDGKERQRRFDELCTALRPDLFRFAFWLSRDRAMAEDVVQETLLRAWRAMDELRDVKAARQWLLTIVRREHARLYERKRLQTVDVDDLVAREELLLAAPDDSEVQDLRRALLQLEESYREPLVLQVLMGYSTEEIAQHMGLNVGAVLTRLFRARQQLRQILTAGDALAPRSARLEGT